MESKLTERLSGLPTTEELQESADTLFARLPNYTVGFSRTLQDNICTKICDKL